MSRKDLFFWFVAGVILCIVFPPLPAKAQGKSETVQQLEVLRDIIASQNDSIKALAGALAKTAEKGPVVIGGFPQQPAPVQVVEAEKPCEDSLIGCALRGVGSLLAKAGSKGIDFLDRNAVPLLQVVAQDRTATRQAEAAIEQSRFAYMERRDVANAHSAAVSGLGLSLQTVATRGFDVFAGLPPQSVTTNNISGTGINFGNGTLNYNPVTGSYNPVNPTSRTCAIVGTAFVCQ